MNHDDLVKLAARWLATTRKCVLVMEEAACWATREYPDAIGWTVQGYSIVVECKVSVRDFLKDKSKPMQLHKASTGIETMGRERWYLTPKGLLQPTDLPQSYGLLEPRGNKLRRVVSAATEEREGRQAAELPLLINAARRTAWTEGVKDRCIRLINEPVTSKS